MKGCQPIMAERTERDKAVPNGMVEGDFFIHIENHAQRISAGTKQQQGKTAGTERLIELAKHKIRLTPQTIMLVFCSALWPAGIKASM